MKELPPTLDETYDRILQSIPEEDKRTAHDALIWLCYSDRPLLVDELAEAATFNPGLNLFQKEDRLIDPSDILKICSSLIRTNELHLKQVNGSRTEVHLAHFSVKEYLISRRIQDGPTSYYFVRDLDAHTYISHSCLGYLRLFSQPSSLQKITLGRKEIFTHPTYFTCVEYPLLAYAAMYWQSHVRIAEMEAKGQTMLQDLVLEFFAQQSYWFLNWYRITNPEDRLIDDHKAYIVAGFKDLPSPLYFASRYGLFQTAKRLLEQGADVMGRRGKLGTALQASASNGHEELAMMLVQRGAEVDAAGEYENTSLAWAAIRGLGNLARKLLDHGANVDGPLGDARTPLFYSIFYRHNDITGLLFENGADVNQDSCLHRAIELGSITLVKRLLMLGCDINLKGDDNTTPVQMAAKNGHEEILECLREHKAGLSGALTVAAKNGHFGIVQKLLDWSVHPDDTGLESRPALYFAALSGEESVVKLLLGKGASVTKCSAVGETALMAAASNGFEKIASHLIGACPDAHHVVNQVVQKGGDSSNIGIGFGPLHFAARHLHRDVIQILLTHGANINHRSMYYGTVLQMVSAMPDSSESQWSRDSVIELLIRSGAYPKDLTSLIQISAHGSEIQEVRRLVECGAKVNDECGMWGTALQAAASIQKGNEEVVEYLLGVGAHPDCLGGIFGIPLYAAVKHRNLGIMGLLLEAGSDPNMVTQPYQSAIDCLQSTSDFDFDMDPAASMKDVLDLLLEYGADPARCNLHSAASLGHTAKISELLEDGADVNEFQETIVGGETPLVAAIENEHYGTVKLLLDSGADVNGDICFYKPLYIAARVFDGGHMVKLLLDYGADIDATSKQVQGETALFTAAKHMNTAAVRLLLDAGAKMGNRWICNNPIDAVLSRVIDGEENEELTELLKLLREYSGELYDDDT